MVKIILVAIVFLVAILPAFLSDKVEEKEDVPVDNSPRKTYPRWKGPKTDERINRMFMESIGLMKELGVPISESICPDVVLTSGHSYLGRCRAGGNGKKYMDYAFYIQMSGFALNNTEKCLRTILIHELIHTVPGGLCHTGEWKKWAKFVSSKTEYKIQRLADEDAVLTYDTRSTRSA